MKALKESPKLGSPRGSPGRHQRLHTPNTGYVGATAYTSVPNAVVSGLYICIYIDVRFIWTNLRRGVFVSSGG